MKNFLKCLVVLLLIINVKESAQDINKFVGSVGNQKISGREFKIRYELVPHLSRDQFSEDSSKQDLLYSIIAEKLLALESNRLGYDTTEYFRNSMQQIRDLYVRDALYKRKIDSQVKISQQDIQKALSRYSQSLEVKIISAKDSSTIFTYYKGLQNGASFESIEKVSDPIEYDSNKAPMKITYGQMQDDYVEDTLYSLNIGSFSSPVNAKGSWFIFKLVGKITRAAANANDPNYDKTVLNIIRMRKSRVIGVKYLENFYKNKKAIVDSTLFLNLAEKVAAALSDKKQNNDYGREGFLYLDEGNILKIFNELGSASNADLVHIEKSPVKVKEFLFSLIVYPFLIKDPSFKKVAYELMANLNKYIQYKFLADEGFKEGLQNIPEVKEDINIWKDDYLAKMLKNTFRDSVHVSDEDIKNYYMTNKDYEKVDILEIMNNDLQVIENVFNDLKAGKDFRDLAREYTQRSWTKNKGGEFGYFPITAFGEIGRIASRLKLNQVYGPIRTDSGYSVIKLIGKKIDSTKTYEDFDSMKTQLKYDLLGKQFDQKFYKYIAELADKYQFSINEKNFQNVKVTSIPMFTYRYIGFGGRIAAVPYLGQWYEWINYVKNKSVLIP